VTNASAPGPSRSASGSARPPPPTHGREGRQPPHHRPRPTCSPTRTTQAKPSPIPLESCPWCGASSTGILPPAPRPTDHPRELVVRCSNRDCVFSAQSALPIVAVDEPLYRRLPCFLIATVDKFASLPWVGEAGRPARQRVDRADSERLLRPRRARQGPRAAEVRCAARPDHPGRAAPDLRPARHHGRPLRDRPRRARHPHTARPRIRPRSSPPPRRCAAPRSRSGPCSGARWSTSSRRPAPTRATPSSPAPSMPGSQAREERPPLPRRRRQGRSLKVVLLRTYLALLAAAQRAWQPRLAAPSRQPRRPVHDLLGYFNSLRELGGSRRIVEDEVNARLPRLRAAIARFGETRGPFASRASIDLPQELTSRESTSDVAETKRRLACASTRRSASTSPSPPT
jgi:hypothetical protein